MKNKKLLTVIISSAMAATLTLTAFAGCAKEEHRYRWEILKEATCVEEGERRGVCGIHGDVVEEKIPVDPDNHNYGEWDVTKVPTETETGTAVKTCRDNSSHTATVELPVLTEEGTGYKSSDVTRPSTSITEGARTFVFEHALGDVSFDIALPMRALETVEDAVLLGSSKRDRLRRATGRYTDAKTLSDGASYNSFTCEYGNNFIHVTDSGNKTEYWYSVDADGNPFGVGTIGDGYPAVDLSVTAKNVLGFRYLSGGGSFVTYGAEDALLTYYNKARQQDEKGTAVFFKEVLRPADSSGAQSGEFSYSYYENPFFCRYNVEFTLNGEGVITSLVIQTMVIRGYMIAEDGEGNKLFYKEGEKKGDIIFAEVYPQANELPEGDPKYSQSTDPVYETDADGNVIYDGYKTDVDGNELLDSEGNKIPRPKPYKKDTRTYYSNEHKEVSVREVIFDAPTLKKEGDVEPVNKYTPDECYLKGFDVKYNGRLVGNDPVTIPSNRAVTFNLDNVQPETALLNYDPLLLYARTDEGDKLLTSNFGENIYNMIGICSPERRTVTINVRYAGEITLVLKSRGGGAEKIVKLNVEKGVPSNITAQAYSYSDAGGKEVYSWSGYSLTSPLTLYVNKPVLLRATTSAEEAKFADLTVLASCLNSETGDVETNISFTEATDPETGEKVIQAVATKPGTYAVYLECEKDGNVYCSLNITVQAAPDMAKIFSGEYECRLDYVQLAEGSNPRPADLNIAFSFDSNWRYGNIVIDINGNKFNYTYEYDEVTGKLTAARKSGDGGLSGATLDFDFAVNQEYKLTIEHSTPFDEKEKVVLSRVEQQS